jgi:polyhydroxyalkanoate synthesis regulator phasin
VYCTLDALSISERLVSMLLEKGHTRRQELEQEVPRLLAGIARQNDIIADLEQHTQHWEVPELQRLVAGLTEQKTQLRQDIAQLTQEDARLRGPGTTLKGNRRGEARQPRDL